MNANIRATRITLVMNAKITGYGCRLRAIGTVDGIGGLTKAGRR